MQEVLHIVALSLGSIIVLFFLTKLMGYRQMSELSMFDYINGITIGSIAAEMATSVDEGFEKPMIAMIVYGVVAILLSYITAKSMRIRRWFTGAPLILMDKGIIYEKNLLKAKIDINEFLTQCRISGYFDIATIQTAILEDNGKISFLPVESERPATPADFELAPAQKFINANIIIDGNIMWNNLKQTGKDENWLNNQLKAHGVSKTEDVVLATYVSDSKINVYIKTDEQMTHSVLM